MKALAVCALLAGPAAAMTQQQCADSLEGAAGFIPVSFSFTLPAVLNDGSCELRGLVADPDGPLVVEIDRLRWNAEDVDRFIRDALPPTALTIEATGLRSYVQLDDPALNYGFRLAAQPVSMAARIDLSWDAEARQLTVDALDWSDGRGNAVAARGLIEGVDLTSWATLAQSAGAGALVNATFRVQSFDLVERYLAMGLAPLLLSGSEPAAAQVAALKEEGRAIVARVPDAILPDGAKAALNILIDDMPQPRGVLDLSVQATPGLGMGRFARFALSGPPDSLDALWPALDGVTLAVEWTPGPVD